MKSLPLRFTIAVSLAAVAAPASAQDASCIAAIRSFRDSLAGVTDVATLRELHLKSRSLADSLEGEPMAELRLGFLDLRMATLTGDDRFWEEASRTFEWVTKDHPERRLAWLGFGLAALGEARTVGAAGFGLRKMLGMDPAREIVASFLKSSGPDSLHGEGVIEVGQSALGSRDAVTEDVALRTVRAMPTRALARDPELALIRARLEREVGDKDSATSVVDLAARLHQDHPGILRVQAMMLFLTGESDGAGPWYRGLNRASGQVLHSFRRDLEMVTPDSVMAKFDAASPLSRESVVRAFWASQDADGLPTEDDRLAEHYRRLDFARHNYVRTTIHRGELGYDIDTLGVTALDRRGEIMLLHGSPTIRSSLGRHDGPEVDEVMGVIGMPRNESWRYERTDGFDQFYHFMADDKDSDFRSVESLMDILANSNQYRRFRGDQPPLGSDSAGFTVKTYGAELVSTIAQELLQSRRKLSPVYSEFLNQGRDGADSLQRREREIGRESLALPYSYELGFELPMKAGIDVLAIGSDHLGPILQVAFAVEASDLTPRSLARGVVYPIRMRVAVRDVQSGEIVVVVDTVRGFVTPQRLRPGQHLLGQLPLRVPGGEYRVRVALESDRRGTLRAPVSVTVPHVGGAEVTLSDLSIGVRSVPIRWRAPSTDTAWANPTGVFSREEPMQLYYEVGGITSGTEYDTQLAIDRFDRREESDPVCSGRGGMMTIASSRRHPGGVDRVHAELSLERLRPGDYLLTTTVSDRSGVSQSRCRVFSVTD